MESGDSEPVLAGLPNRGGCDFHYDFGGYCSVPFALASEIARKIGRATDGRRTSTVKT